MILTRNTLLAAVASVACTMGAAVNASTVTANFNFRAPPVIASSTSQMFSNNGIDVTVTGQYYTAPTAVGDAFAGSGALQVQNNSYGLISCNPSEIYRGRCPSPGHAVDSIDGFEGMIFDFGSKVVDLTSLAFGWSWNSKYGSASNSSKGFYDLFVDGLYAGNSKDGLTFPAVGTKFVVGARSDTYSYDCSIKRWKKVNGRWKKISIPKTCTKTQDVAFKISDMSVDYTPPPSPVPLPAGAVLLISGLAGLGIARKRKA